MVFAILIKWTTNWDGYPIPPPIINIYTNGGAAFPGFVLWGDDQGVEQTKVQQSLFLVALILAPIMLFPKPIITVMMKKKPEHNANHQKELEAELIEDDEDTGVPQPVKSSGGHDNDGFGEIMIHQLIETIEFILGSISNTASYLRLWALSLAHSQLAKVFLDMTIMGGLKSGSFIMAFCGFPIWLFATVGVLMMMDLMECFLHALRLHWVEFQNKFFKGDGYQFKPFSFKNSCEYQLDKYKENYRRK